MFEEARRALPKGKDTLIKFFESNLFRDFLTKGCFEAFRMRKAQKIGFLTLVSFVYPPNNPIFPFLKKVEKQIVRAQKVLVFTNLYFTMKNFGNSLPHPNFCLS